MGTQGGQPCKTCNGTGGRGNQGDGEQGAGSGMGRQPGQGRGGKAEQEKTDVAFRTEKQKLYTGKGAIIGQFLFDGEQIPGEATSNLSETVSASEREASELIHRDRLPRQYHRAVRAYFSSMKRDLKQPSDDSKKTEEGSKEGLQDGGAEKRSESEE